MTQDNKIWHTPDEQPGYFPAQLVAELENGRLFYFERNGLTAIRDDWFYLLSNIEYETMCPIRRWTYLQNFIAVNKALDVATERIRKWYEAFADKPQYGAFALEFEHALQEINEIMKGGKQ